MGHLISLRPATGVRPLGFLSGLPVTCDLTGKGNRNAQRRAVARNRTCCMGLRAAQHDKSVGLDQDTGIDLSLVTQGDEVTSPVPIPALNWIPHGRFRRGGKLRREISVEGRLISKRWVLVADARQ